MDHGMRIDRALKGKRMELIVQVEESQHVLARTMRRRQFQALPDPWPGVRNGWLQGKPCFVVVPQVHRVRPPQSARTQLREFRLGHTKLCFIPPRSATAPQPFPDIALQTEQGPQGLP